MGAELRRPRPGDHAGRGQERQLQHRGAQQQVAADHQLGAQRGRPRPPGRPPLAGQRAHEQRRRDRLAGDVGHRRADQAQPGGVHQQRAEHARRRSCRPARSRIGRRSSCTPRSQPLPASETSSSGQPEAGDPQPLLAGLGDRPGAAGEQPGQRPGEQLEHQRRGRPRGRAPARWPARPRRPRRRGHRRRCGGRPGRWCRRPGSSAAPRRRPAVHRRRPARPARRVPRWPDHGGVDQQVQRLGGQHDERRRAPARGMRPGHSGERGPRVGAIGRPGRGTSCSRRRRGGRRRPAPSRPGPGRWRPGSAATRPGTVVLALEHAGDVGLGGGPDDVDQRLELVRASPCSRASAAVDQVHTRPAPTSGSSTARPVTADSSPSQPKGAVSNSRWLIAAWSMPVRSSRAASSWVPGAVLPNRKEPVSAASPAYRQVASRWSRSTPSPSSSPATSHRGRGVRVDQPHARRNRGCWRGGRPRPTGRPGPAARPGRRAVRSTRRPG